MIHRFIQSSFVLGIILAALGCTPESEIEVHRIRKDRSGLEKLRQPVASMTPADTTPAQKTRMAVAIFDNPDATWFFKVNGPESQVTESEKQWMDFFETVTFTDGEPGWDLPEGWSTGAAKPMRHSTLFVGDTTPPLELAISSLGPDQDLLLNINRWRGQIGLSPTTEADLPNQIKNLESNAGKYLVFDATGIGSGKMRPPFAGGMPPSTGSAPFAGAPTAAKKSNELSYTAPDGWTEGRTSSMVKARLSKTSDGKEAQITIVPLTATGDGGKWEPNVKRWADQVGLGQLSVEQLAKRTSKLTVDGIDGQLVDLVDLDSDAPTATIAGMVLRDQSAWFIKLSGDKAVVDESREDFQSFIASLRFK